jgi:hypothetical protein
VKTPDGASSIIYYSEEIMPENRVTKFTNAKLNGFPLEMEINQGGMKIKMVAKSVDANPQSTSQFDMTVPEDYKAMSFAEFMEMAGGLK